MSNKNKFLSGLARFNHPASNHALTNQIVEIKTKLSKTNNYLEIEELIELLGSIASSDADDAIAVFSALLESLKSLQLFYPRIEGVPEDHYKFYTSDRLVIKILETLKHVRYYKISEIFDIFLHYSINENAEIKKAAIDGLSKMSEYNLDAVNIIGFAPQLLMIDKMRAITKEDKNFLIYLDVLLEVGGNLLSATMSGTSWSYQSVTLKSAQVPVSEEIKKIRSNALEIFKSIYQNHDLTIRQKLSIISALNSANGIHSHGTSEEFMEIVYENTREVLQFFKEVIKNEKLQVMQKIEHDAYWLCYHRGKDEQVSSLAFEIRDYLFSQEDYQMYRTLVGFESIFTEWETREKNQLEDESVDKYKKRNDEREAKVFEYAESINSDNFPEWESRIIRYSETESNDLATFPFFAKFLEHFCEYSPELGMKLMDNQLSKLQDFLPCIFSGLWNGDKNTIRARMEGWIGRGLYLSSIVRIFEFNGDFDEDLLKKLLVKAIEQKDKNVLKQIISSVAANYNQSKKYLVSDFFIPVIEELNKLDEAGWIFNLWYRIERNGILSDLGNYGVKTILGNLLKLNKIDYQAEEILGVICKTAPDQVIDFFVKRLDREKDSKATVRFDAIPYEFYKLHTELSKVPEIAIKKVRQLYDGNYGMFIFRGARFLKIIFPEFSTGFELELNKLLNSDNEDDILFVLGILRNYAGKQAMHGICKKIIDILPENHRLLNEIKVALFSTDGVWGEYGLLNAYQERTNLVSQWLDGTESRKIQHFVQDYVSEMQKRMEMEKIRVDDSVDLMKHKYGDDDK